MKRSLVLTNEAARHHFRQLLPPPGALPPIVAPAMSDARFFALTFSAAFLAFYGYLS